MCRDVNSDNMGSVATSINDDTLASYFFNVIFVSNLYLAERLSRTGMKL